jgi:pyruvate-ferredoxin/flavodoxin oxidoreductase
MAESVDAWSAEGKKNLWGAVPSVVQMQSESGAIAAVHGALQAGSLSTTFTSSQGLLLMIPNLYKIAGEMNAAVFHVAARSVASHALSIFGDHSDVMAARATGLAMLCSSSVQEAQDFALIAQAATLESRLPFIHFFDGFRTSHEIGTVAVLSDEVLSGMIDESWIRRHRNRALNPDHPVLRGTAQNPDVFFQGREAANPYYAAVPGIVEKAFARFAELIVRPAFSSPGAPPPAAPSSTTAGRSARATSPPCLNWPSNAKLAAIRKFDSSWSRPTASASPAATACSSVNHVSSAISPSQWSTSLPARSA